MVGFMVEIDEAWTNMYTSMSLLWMIPRCK